MLACIEITSTPPSRSGIPEWVRKKWVGCKLPLDPLADHRGGWAVNPVTAVKILEEQDAAAARWFLETAPNFFVPGNIFYFAHDCAELIEGNAEPWQGDGLSMEGFLALLNPHNEHNAAWDIWLEDAMSRAEGGQLLADLLTHPLDRTGVLALRDLVAIGIAEELEHCSAEGRYANFLQQGHALLRQMAKLAGLNGVPIGLEEVDRALSPTDAMVLAGLAELHNGEIRLTPDGQADAAAFREELGMAAAKRHERNG